MKVGGVGTVVCHNHMYFGQYDAVRYDVSIIYLSANIFSSFNYILYRSEICKFDLE